MRSNDLTQINFQTVYRTGTKHEPHEMMSLCLGQSTMYRRASGYFSSSILSLFKRETLEFAQSGGTIDLMCSPVMSADDLNQISLGYEAKNLLTTKLLTDVKNMSTADTRSDQLSFLATLIKESVLNIKLIFLKNGAGIFHDKSGYFQDDQHNVLSFSGSANESSNAFSGSGNFERISVFPSWNAADRDRCNSTRQYVDDLWLGNVSALGVFDFPDVAKEFLLGYAKNNLDELKPIFSPKPKPTKKSKTLMRHQSVALNNWQKAGKRGILKHATGSGKTVTAIAAIKDHINTGHPTLVLVPSKLLLSQWYKEIKNEIGDVLIMRCGAGHTSWRRSSNLQQMLKSSPGNEQGGIVLAVNDTAVSHTFVMHLDNLQNTLIVADEVHSLGSNQNRQILKKDFAFRLGLSATPERYRDDEGTAALFNFFGGIVEPEVTLGDALKSGRLVPYDYYPVTTLLNAEEEEDWLLLTNKIINYIRSRDLDALDARADSILSSMLINRARIAKKAHTKIEAALSILKENYNRGEHWLVYCEDGAQLEEISENLKLTNINTFIYVSNMSGSASGELAAFESQSGVLLSIRCLDEGIDIPKISHAIILASSQNPRQFIQRRGRVLRQYPGKLNAVIYDCIVVPANTDQSSKFDGLILSEANRSLEFSTTARNSASATSTIRNILISLGTDPDNVLNSVEGDIEND